MKEFLITCSDQQLSGWKDVFTAPYINITHASLSYYSVPKMNRLTKPQNRWTCIINDRAVRKSPVFSSLSSFKICNSILFSFDLPPKHSSMTTKLCKKYIKMACYLKRAVNQCLIKVYDYTFLVHILVSNSGEKIFTWLQNITKYFWFLTIWQKYVCMQEYDSETKWLNRR